MTVSATLTGGDQYSPVLNPSVLLAIPDSVNPGHYIDLSVSGTWSGIVTLQRRFDGESEWRNTDFIATNVESFFKASLDAEYRIGFRPGDYTSGTAKVRLGIGY
jgi:hypothetical protein